MAPTPRPPSTHLAAVLEHFNAPYEVKQVPAHGNPEGPDILLRVLAASYCHTDSVFASGGLSQTLPLIGCHEFAGEIVDIGPEVPRDLGLEIGVRVGVPGRAYHPCGQCHECTINGRDPVGYSPYCPQAGNLGLTRDGGFQQYCLVDSRQVAPLPETLSSPQAAAMMCAGLTVWSALHHPAVQHRKRIAILGAGGGLGHLGVQFAAHLDFEVFAIDANDGSLELLREVKTQLGEAGSRVNIIDVRKTPADEIKLMTQQSGTPSLPTEMGVEAAILLPDSQAAFDTGMHILRNHGTMVVVSFPKEKLRVNAHDIVFRDISIVGSLVGRNHQLREMLNFVGAHDVQARVQTYSLERINDLVRNSHQSVGKLVIDMAGMSAGV